MGKGVLLFSGVNPRAVISVARFMSYAEIPFHIVAMGTSDEILKTSYANKVLFERTDKRLNEDLFKRCAELLAPCGYESIVVLPTTEFLNRYLLGHRTNLQVLKFEVPLCNQSMYEEISDKISFGKLCERYDILVPEHSLEMPSNAPFVAKPKKYDVQNPDAKPFLVRNQEEMKLFSEKYNPEHYYFQSYIEGVSYYLLYHIHTDTWFRSYAQKNLIQQPQGGSIIMAVPDKLHLSDLAGQYAKMLVREGFEGLVMIELRENNGHYYMIEANPRFWGPMQLTLDAGTDILSAFFAALGFRDVSYPAASNPCYFWSGGLDLREMSKFAWFDYSEEKLMENWSQLIQSDIYNREDTQQLFANAHDSE